MTCTKTNIPIGKVTRIIRPFGLTAVLTALIGVPLPSLADSGCGNRTIDSSDITMWNYDSTGNCPTSCNVYEYDGGTMCTTTGAVHCDYCSMIISAEGILGCQTMGTIVIHPGYCYTAFPGPNASYVCVCISGAQPTSQQGLVPIPCESGNDCNRCL